MQVREKIFLLVA